MTTPRVSEIQEATAGYFELSMADFLSGRRSRKFARPRQLAMFICRMYTARSLPEIGRVFGNRDHTTVIHGIRQIGGLLAIDEDLNAALESIENSVFVTARAREVAEARWSPVSMRRMVAADLGLAA